MSAAVELFAERGIDNVSLRMIARRADVTVSLIQRYIGTRATLVDAVVSQLNDGAAGDGLTMIEDPERFSDRSTLHRWTRVVASNAVAGRQLYVPGFNPVIGVARKLDVHAPTWARIRAAQVVAMDMGWQLFEPYLLRWAGLQVPPPVLRRDLEVVYRRIARETWAQG